MDETNSKRIKLNPYKILGVIYHLPNFIKLIYRLSKDPRVPFFPKMILVAAIVYLISPFDIFPDFLFPLGFIEDIIIMLLVLKAFVKYSPQEVVWQHIKTIEQERRMS